MVLWESVKVGGVFEKNMIVIITISMYGISHFTCKLVSFVILHSNPHKCARIFHLSSF